MAALVDGARRATEDREAALREQINTALQKIRAYARDMEVRAERLLSSPCARLGEGGGGEAR